jgi:hypothetical protein
MPTKSQPVRHIRRRVSFVALMLVTASCAFAAPAGATGYLFWGNSGDSTIGRAERNGTNVNQAFSTANGPPAGVAVTPASVYWNWGSAIGRANVDDGTVVTQDFVSGLTTGTALAASSSLLYWSDTGTSQLGRVALSGTGPEADFLTGVTNVTAIAVDGSFIYYSHDGDSIGRANLDGSGAVPAFITGATGVQGIAVDAAHVYWSESAAGNIGRANIDGSSPDHAFITGGDQTFGVAVDNARIYWANKGANRIGRADIDGSGVNQAAINGADAPTGLAVLQDPPAAPVLTSTDPASPANDNFPELLGSAPANTVVTVFDDAACTHAVAQGPSSKLMDDGIGVLVADNTTVTLRATASNGQLDRSPCSNSVTYIEDSKAPATPADVSALPPFEANDFAPRVKGIAESGSLVKVFTDPACGGDPIARGDAATFASPGIALPPGAGDPTTTPYYATATDPAGNTSACTAAKGPKPGLSDPQVGKTANITPVSGTTTVKCPGTTNDQLTAPRQIPIGCTLDTTNGRVSVTTANGQGANQTANFYDGKFKLLYTADKVKGKKTVFTLVNLVGPKPKNCKKSAKAKRGKKGKKHAVASKARKGRRLWGSGKGRYRTRGSHSAATVRGTIWLTKDTCAGTLTVVKRGVVDVWDFGRHKRVTVRKGHRYLARASRGH